jgi:hypothetical protein
LLEDRQRATLYGGWSKLDTRNNRDFGSALTGFVFDGSSIGI